jgi:hypothetical protein
MNGLYSRGTQILGARVPWQINFVYLWFFSTELAHYTLLTHIILTWLLDFWKICATLLLLSTLVLDGSEWSNLHLDCFILRGEKPPIPTGSAAVLAPEPVWTFYGRKNPLLLPQIVLCIVHPSHYTD